MRKGECIHDQIGNLKTGLERCRFRTHHITSGGDKFQRDFQHADPSVVNTTSLILQSNYNSQILQLAFRNFTYKIGVVRKSAILSIECTYLNSKTFHLLIDISMSIYLLKFSFKVLLDIF